MTLELHPLCTLFPRMGGAEFDALKADIIAHGLREPITVHDGMVLDGGNRYRACIEAGIEPALKNFAGIDAAAFVFSANFHRRHLTAGQQAIIVAQAQNWTKAQQVGRPEKSGSTAGLKTVADRVSESGASERAQRMADQLAREAPELAKKVADGELSLPKAHAQLAPRSTAAASSAAPSLAPKAVDQQIDIVSDEQSEPEVDHFDQLLTEFHALKKTHEEAVARVHELEALLSANDLASQVDVLTEKCARLDSLARSRHTDVNDALGEVAKKKAFIDLLRKASGVGKDGDLLEFVTRAARGGA